MSSDNGDFPESNAWQERASGLLDQTFGSCADDPVASVHRAWGISLIFILLYFCLSVMESELIASNRISLQIDMTKFQLIMPRSSYLLSLAHSVKSQAGSRFQSSIDCSSVDGNCAFADCGAWYFYLETISHNLCHWVFPRCGADSRQSKFYSVRHIPQLLLWQWLDQPCVWLGRLDDGHRVDGVFIASLPFQTQTRRGTN